MRRKQESEVRRQETGEKRKERFLAKTAKGAKEN